MSVIATAKAGCPEMNPLRTLENMIAGLVEGTFGRVFKAEVRPMELARKLAREMDENKTASVSRVYAPNEYSVWLSPKDRARYEGVEHEVIDELCAYLLEHARGEDLALASRPSITFHTDEQLKLGEFGIEARLARPEDGAREHEEQAPPSPARARQPPESPPRVAAVVERSDGVGEAPYEEPVEIGNTMIFSNSERVRDAVERTGARRRPKALLVMSGRRLLVPPRPGVAGHIPHAARRSGAAATVTSCSTIQASHVTTPICAPREVLGRSRISDPPTGSV